MKGKTFAYSRLPRILAESRCTVADFIKRLNAKGIALDKKTVYRLASAKPIETINTRVLGAVCEELKIGLGDIITWEQPKVELHRIDDKTQERLSFLMRKNNEGKLTKEEKSELSDLGAYAEELSLENARMLAGIAGAKRSRENVGSHRGAAAPKRFGAASKARKAKRRPGRSIQKHAAV